MKRQILFAGILLAVTVASMVFLFGGGSADALPLAAMATAAAPGADLGELLRKFDGHHAEVKGLFESAGAKLTGLEKKQDECTGRLTEIEQVLAQRRGGGGGEHRIQTAGASVIVSESFKSFGGSRRRGKIVIDVKTITTESGSAGPMIAPDRRSDIVMLPQQRLTVRDLLGVAQTSSNSIEYPRQTVRTNNARVVTEGDTKPTSIIEFELKTVPVRTIAHLTKASLQALDDAPMLQGTIDSELRYGLKLVEEDELLFGDGTGQHLNGIITQATAYNYPFAQLTADSNRFDILLAAIAQSEAALLPATGIVLNDLDLTQMRTIKDDEGRYVVSGGPFAGPITSIWGRPVVGTASMAEGEFLVGAFKDGAMIFDRWEARVQISTENDTDFEKNLCTIRGEERLALAVKRPSAFIHGDFDVATG